MRFPCVILLGFQIKNMSRDLTPDQSLVLEGLVVDLLGFLGHGGIESSNFMDVVIRGMRFLETAKSMPGPDRKRVLLLALARLIERQVVATTGVDETFLKALIESPVTLAVVDAICTAAKGGFGINRCKARNLLCCWSSKTTQT